MIGIRFEEKVVKDLYSHLKDKFEMYKQET